MTLTFVTNFVHHHQLPVADEFYHLLGKDYCYIATESLPDWLIKGGYDPTLDRDYIVRSHLSDEEMTKARKIIDDSDVVIAGDAPLYWFTKRKREGKVTFHCSERIYKKKIPWLRLPLHAIKNYLNYGRYKRTYMLCASAFTAYDYGLTFCFRNKCFKWGYMTAVNSNTPSVRSEHISSGRTRIMWCARFIWWKHPELPVLLADRLSQKGYQFVIDMFGGGEEYEKIESLITELGVDCYVRLCGNHPNAEILEQMSGHDIFLFTSDRNEGWGAVLNEAMSSGCVPVASDEIGSVPYLIKNGNNGICFKSCDLDSLEEAVCKLLENPDLVTSMSKNAFLTISNDWSPREAAMNFMDLARHACDNSLKMYTRFSGPASWDTSK